MKLLAEKTVMSLEMSDIIADACIAESTLLGVAVSIAITDDGGQLKYFRRMDGTGIATIDVAEDKAFCAASTKTPTDAWYEIAQADPAFGFGLASLPRFCPLAGGLPIVVANEVIGAIGISGGSNAQDLAIARAGLTAAVEAADRAERGRGMT